MVSNWPIERELFFMPEKSEKKAIIDKKENRHQITKRFFYTLIQRGLSFIFGVKIFQNNFFGEFQPNI